jgi:hypothetical protein
MKSTVGRSPISHICRKDRGRSGAGAMTRPEIDEIIVAFMAGDIGEALRLVGVAAERTQAERGEPSLDAVRGGQLERDLRFCDSVRERLLV